MFKKQIQLGLIHVAVAMTLVPINSTLNRVMIKELAISATLVALLASLPYLFSPIQVAIGSFSDRHPIFGYHRTPYIVLGLLLCVSGLLLSPQSAFLMEVNPVYGISLGIFAFGAWGMGFNFSSVSYLSLASEISGEKYRGRTIAIMWFMMITGIIVTAIMVGQMVDPYTPNALQRAFIVVGFAALVLGSLGLINLEASSRDKGNLLERKSNEGYSWGVMFRDILKNRQATYFFIYLAILLTALLGQDILLEPFGAEAFGLSVKRTTQITSIWGVCVLLAIILAGFLERRFSKKKQAHWGGWSAFIGFLLIVLSRLFYEQVIFYSGIILLGIGTGISTVANLSIMFDMTTKEHMGMYIGAWGMSNAVSRLMGSILGGALRDIIAKIFGDPVIGYQVVFFLLSLCVLISLGMLKNISVSEFRKNSDAQMDFFEKAALANESA
jgi:MFS transporter, BCD family, chlorophyll transporter